MRRGQRQAEQSKLKLGMQIDDKSFQNLLLESQVSCPSYKASATKCRTQVILTKDQSKWNFDALMEMIEGPLLNPKRLEEAIKASKWGRRIMTFFHPFNHRFSDMPRTKVSFSYE